MLSREGLVVFIWALAENMTPEQIFLACRKLEQMPIIENKPFMQTLSVNLSGRKSNYSTGISTNTYGLGLEWAPVRAVRFRGTVQHARQFVQQIGGDGRMLGEQEQRPGHGVGLRLVAGPEQDRRLPQQCRVAHVPGVTCTLLNA